MYSRLPRAVAALGLASTLVLGACRSAPPYQGMGAEELYRHAVAAYEEEDWEEAIRALDRLLVAFPTFPRQAEAMTWRARAYFQDEQWVTSASEFTRILDRYPSSEVAPEAALGVCRSYAALSPIPQRDQSYTEQALVTCRDVPADFPGTPEAATADSIRQDMVEKLAAKDFQAGEFYFRRDLYDSANIYYQDVVDLYPETRWAPRALKRLYESFTEIGYEDDAQEARDLLLERYPDSPEAREFRGGSA